MSIQVGMISLGCSKNQVDAERMLWMLQEDGFSICNEIALCDAVIVNTCGFIEEAKKESIESILDLAPLKENGSLKVIAVTGCLAERYREEVAKEMPEVDVLLGIGCNGSVAAAIKKALAGERTVDFADKETLSLEGERVLANAPYFAYLKVADGCDNRCSYCAIPLIRGRFRSRRMEDVLDEAKTLARAGVTELNVVAQDTTRYGEDLYGRLMLPALLEELCGIAELHWIRLLYCYPQRITDELLQTMAKHKKIVPYMDIPLQHVSGRILREMNRQGDAKSLEELMLRIRGQVPGIVLRTTMITGFPGETEEDFEALCSFISRVRFDRLGCFTYSQEEDTPAALMENQIEEETKRRRAEIIMEMQMDIAAKKALTLKGTVLEVLCEGYDSESEMWYGRSYMDAPDIDTRVYFDSASGPAPGEYVQVRITDAEDYDLIGELLA